MRSVVFVLRWFVDLALLAWRSCDPYYAFHQCVLSRRSPGHEPSVDFLISFLGPLVALNSVRNRAESRFGLEWKIFHERRWPPLPLRPLKHPSPNHSYALPIAPSSRYERPQTSSTLTILRFSRVHCLPSRCVQYTRTYAIAQRLHSFRPLVANLLDPIHSPHSLRKRAV